MIIEGGIADKREFGEVGSRSKGMYVEGGVANLEKYREWVSIYRKPFAPPP